MNIKVDRTQLLASLKKKLAEYNKNNKRHEITMNEYERAKIVWQEEIRTLVHNHLDEMEFDNKHHYGLTITKCGFSAPPVPPAPTGTRKLDTTELERFISLVEMCTTDVVSLSVLKGVDKYL
jgi:hypothetical protein